MWPNSSCYLNICLPYSHPECHIGRVGSLLLFSCSPRCVELQEQLASAEKQRQQVTYDLSHLHGDRSGQYKNLKIKEEAMKGWLMGYCVLKKRFIFVCILSEFLETFESSYSNEKVCCSLSN